MSNYSKNRVFTDGGVNAIIDKIHYELARGIPFVILNASMCLTGRAAAILQGADTAPCDNIIFIVNKQELYAHIQYILPKSISHKGVLRFKERTIIYLESAIVEVWFDTSAVVAKSPVGGVYVQNIKEINPILL
jgi:hypothetical protein